VPGTRVRRLTLPMQLSCAVRSRLTRPWSGAGRLLPAAAGQVELADGRVPARPLVEAVLLMAGSLLLVLLVNAAARELTARYPVGEVLFCRFFGAACLLAILSGRALVPAIRTPRLKLHLLRALLGAGGTLALYAASQHLAFSDLMAIAYSSPIIVAILSWPLLGERVGGPRAGLILAGFAGILLVTFPGRVDPWSFGALVMALLNAGALIVTRRLGRTDSAATIGLCFAVFGTFFTAPLLVFGCTFPEARDGTLFLALGGAAGLAIHLHAQAFRRAAAAILAPIDYFAVVISPAFAWLFWAESPSSSMLTGGAVIVTAGILQLREAHREACQPQIRL
jgi:drug/metabolite transporter (DMT)-like permease